MSLVLVSDGFVGVGKKRSSAHNNSFIMAAAQASSFAANKTDKEFTGESTVQRKGLTFVHGFACSGETDARVYASAFSKGPFLYPGEAMSPVYLSLALQGGSVVVG